MSLSREPLQEWNSWDQLVQEKPQVNLRICTLRLAVVDLRYALRAMRSAVDGWD
jgi:hypothetical protein